MFARPPLVKPNPSPVVLEASFRPVDRRPVSKTVISNDFADLACIYEDDVNLCLIERPIPAEIEQFVYAALEEQPHLEISSPVNPEQFDFDSLWPKAKDIPGYRSWTADVALLVSAFCELFELREAGLRLYTLNKAMCPRFHVDRVAARLICSYGGIGTEWLPEYAVDRGRLGMGGRNLPDNESGLILDETAVRRMPAYAVGLMKGEHWEGNEGHGFVHRSPTPTAVQPRRLLLTLDML